MPLLNLLAADVGSSEIVSGVQAATNAITSQFTISTIVSVIGIVLASCVGLFLFWWGARKVLKMVMNTFKGKSLKL